MKTYPPATPASMQFLVTLLDRRGIALRVVNGDLQLRDLAKRLTDADRAVVHAYAVDLARVLSDPSMLAQHHSDAPSYWPGCRSCGADIEGDSVTYRTDPGGELLERCVRCGATWAWGDPGEADALVDLVTKPP